MAKINYDKSWDAVPAYTGGEAETLELGGHYLEIVGAELREGVGANGPWQAVRIAFDTHITDSQPGFFRRAFDRAKQWAEQDGEKPKWPNSGTGMVFIPQADADNRQIGRWNGFVKTLETSNPDWKWDLDTDSLRGKLIGGVFREEEWEYEGRTGMSVRLAWFCEVESVPEARIPEPRMLNRRNQRTQPTPAPSNHADLPFDL